MTILSDFITRFPNFSEVTAGIYIPILEDVYPCYWIGNYDTDCGKEIVLNLLAHMMIQETQTDSTSSPLKAEQSKSVGNVSVSYEMATTATNERNAWFRSTSYGIRFLTLTMNKHGGCFV